MADAAYLKREVSDALVQGLASVVAAEPEDPVEHLGQFLLSYVDAAERNAAEAARLAQIESDRKEAEAAAAAAAKAAKPQREREEADQRLVEQLTKVFEGGNETSGAIKTLLGALQRWTGAAGVYVAERVAGAGGGDDEEGGGDTAKYVHATDDHSWLVGKTLAKGVTFDAWKLPPAPEAEEDGGDEDEEGEGKKKDVPPPEYPVVHVPQVLHDDRVTLHKMPKLGAYLAVPVVYNSSVHDGGIVDADVEAVLEAEAKYAAEDAEKAAAEEAKKEADAEAKEAGEDAEAAEPAPEEDEEAKAGREAAEKEAADARAEALRPKINTKQVFLALCLDTVGGSGVDFTPEQRASAAAWGKQLAAALAGIEARQALEEWNRRKAAVVANRAALEGAEEAAEAAKAAEEAAVEESSSKLAEDASDEAKATAAAVAVAQTRASALAAHADAIADLGLRRMAPQGAVRKVLDAVLTHIGRGSDEVADWGAARANFSADLPKKLADFNYATGLPSGGLTEGADAAEIAKASVAVAALLSWSQAADAAIAAGKAQREKEEADAAAAAQAAADAAAAAEAEEGKGEEDA
uniref:Uncharacterized protein n=1 Tax=Bicosoecida sp. CB-2014 TaxID=1486930 RepID=A0A7S1CAY1_9STRA|mmetsp:Transcript_17615/g.61992  ORF Transcript_17615/g.61992 Transcript_17615/m.61992 type:complete len:579 (+) Transcript_17615:205-1941(+)|eukprot:CAMPEP_0203818410 /NCGR_PEP_ID=MMETSP0115-20131106/31425_1 /ASSEMBLY_ACC=CAM_ASM_000227 /TAXON_ID=33651 /ORGANISM="Bicosoecid sp, Strain ms1" /LENGTH=578 /DNA_ID=CAMNT_0050727375 /DNA_START=140 /DNA_END=1876 /DNA_ORIENTATION=-